MPEERGWHPCRHRSSVPRADAGGLRWGGLDNLTHSLTGAAFAELALRRDASARARAFVLGLGVVAANLPDVDLLYTGLTPGPLGYLLHHRGHTHTVLGLVPQALLLLAVLLVPRWRGALDAACGRWRVVALIVAGVASHLVMDGWNSYGVHPFAPLDPRWMYGDAVFIFEPWLWLLLAAAAAWNATSPRRGALLMLLPVLLVGALGVLGVVPPAAVVMLAAGVALFVVLTRSLTRARRSAVALGACLAYVVLLFGVGARVREQVASAYGPALVDIVLNPNPGVAWCWQFLTVENAGGNLVLRRGSVSLLPGWQPPETCPMHGITGLGTSRRAATGVVEADAHVTPLAELRGVDQRNCSAKAWFQFGRAPVLRDGVLFDLRFATGARRNFTTMAVPASNACPPALTAWGRPREDLLR